MGYHGPCKKLQAPISPTGSPETTSSRPWPQWPNRSWRLPYTKSTGRSPQKSFPGYQKKVISKRNRDNDLDWLVGSRGEKHHGQQADHPTLDSAKCCVPIFKDYLNSSQFISSIHSSQLGSTSKSRFNSFCLKILWLAQSPSIFPK